MEIKRELFETEVRQILIDNDYDLYDIEIENFSNQNIVRFLIESSVKQVDLDDCVKATKLIARYLDTIDSKFDEYSMEVATPGIIRKLKTSEHFNAQLNNKVEVKLKKKHPELQVKKITGILNEYTEDYIKLDELKIELSDIDVVRTTYEF